MIDSSRIFASDNLIFNRKGRFLAIAFPAVILFLNVAHSGISSIDSGIPPLYQPIICMHIIKHEGEGGKRFRNGIPELGQSGIGANSI
jgi:hypothetical protein